jgi:mRNA-degrading endonuclease RelE of RelBE toxin-antitoxin system
MNETEKFLRKITKHERDELATLIDALDNKVARDRLHPIKLKGGEFYRIRKGKFRVIFHFENNHAITDSVRFRNEKTYRDI